MTTPRTPADPFLSSRFWVEINSVTQGYFTECSGLKAEVEITPLKEGGTVAITHYMMGPTKWGNIVLKRGWVDSNYLWDWFCKIASGKLDKRPVSIIQFENKGTSASNGYYRWNLTNAFPVKWSGPDWRVDGGGVAVETIQ